MLKENELKKLVQEFLEIVNTESRDYLPKELWEDDLIETFKQLQKKYFIHPKYYPYG